MSEARSALTEREGPDYCRRSGKDVNYHRMNAERPIAIVTGASRGIGAEYARALAGRGRDVLLVARDKARLDQLAEELRARHAVSVEVAVIDLAEPDAAHRLFSAARQFRPVADVLVNNAGFGYFGEFVDMPLARIQAMLRLHMNTVVESVRLFLPAMLERRRGAIINVSSVAGFLSLPYLAEYAATKAFLNAFSEALAEEVRDSGVLIQACCPGSTDTDFHATAGFRPRNPLGAQDPAEVVAVSLAALEGPKVVVTTNWNGRLVAWLSRWVPRGFLVRRAGRWMKPRNP